MSQEDAKNDKIYLRLQKSFNRMPVGLPATESGVEIKLLKELFDPKEALIASRMGYTPNKIDDMYPKWSKSYTKDEFSEKIEGMAKKGLIFRYRHKSGVFYFCVPLVVGMFEFQLNKLTPKFMEYFDQYMEEGLRDYMINTKIPQLRVIPIEESVEKENAITTFDNLEQLILSERGKISIADCICRQKKALEGDPCNHMKEGCFQFGASAEFYVENGIAREISKEEALKIMRQANEEGLVLQPANAQHPNSVCCCCGDACEYLLNLKKFDNPAALVSSNYIIQFEKELCDACGICESRCQMDAISYDADGYAEVNLLKCIGCGLCATTCPSEALVLKKKGETEITIPPKTLTKLHQEILVGKSYGK